jgi:hypothetical protein
MAYGVPNWNAIALVTRGFSNTAPAPADPLLKIAWQTSERSQILPIQAPASNSSFDISFFGPTVLCGAPNTAQQTAFDHYVSRIHNDSGLYVSTNIQNVTNIYPPAPIQELVFSAFSPRWSELVNDVAVDALYNIWKPELVTFSPIDPLRPGVLEDALLQELWIKLADESIICEMTNASYNVHVDNEAGMQKVSMYSIETLPAYNLTYLKGSDVNCSGWDSDAYCLRIKLPDYLPAANYIVWFGAFSNLLNGNTSFSADSASKIYNVTTQMLQQTDLASCPELPEGVKL